MSRSNPTENHLPNPSTRWFEWNGELGSVRYYDKTDKVNVDVGSDFTFILLDQLGSVGGWHDASQSAIYSNEVKDTRQDALVVKAFKGGTLAEGIYQQIRDKVSAVGGQFVATCYIAYKTQHLNLGAIRFKGAALNAWVEFTKANRAGLYSKAVRISGFTEGTKGRVIYRVPKFSLVEVSDETQAAAVALDVELQTYLKAYFARTTRTRAETSAPAHVPDESFANFDHDYDNHTPVTAPSDDDIPF